MNWRQWMGLQPIDLPPVPSAPAPIVPPIMSAPTLPDLDTVNGFVLSQRAIDMIKQWEQCRLEAYPDQGGIPTIGYGTIRIDGKPVRLGMTITQEQAEALLMYEVRPYVTRLNYLITVSLSQNKVDAIVDFVYNCGVGAFIISSLRKAINSNQPVNANLFLRWNKVRDPKTKQLVESRGLTRRRQAEFDLYSLQE